MSEPPAAKQGDPIIGLDTHVVLIPSPGGPIPTPMPMPFSGPLCDALSDSVFVNDLPAAVEGSQARNVPPHIPTGGPFQKAPSNRATVQKGSSSVFADDKPLARLNDPAVCCNDPADAPTGHIVAAGTVFCGPPS
jgi:uncharacterized Zn-binding protein involved in type VI secretion